MAKLCAFRQFVDAVGEPLASGKIYTYITGSSTLKATYTDSTEGTAHPNPIILNSAGVADIWLKTDEAYKFIIKDANDTQIGNSINEIVPVTQLAAQTGGSNLDMSGYAIITSANADLTLTPNGTGSIVLDGQKWPQVDGSAGQILSTGGTGQLLWSTPSALVLDSISDVNITSVADGHLLKYNLASNEWRNSAQSTLSVTASQVSDLATAAVAFSGKTGNISQWTNDSSYTTTAAVATAALAFTNKTGNISQWANDSGYITSIGSVASKAEMETATSTAVTVTPGRLQNHPAAPKAWARITPVNGADPTIVSSHNITSISRSSEGAFTITFTTAFSDTNYCCFASINSTIYNHTAQFVSETTTTVGMTLRDSGTLDDLNAGSTKISLLFFGDQ